MHQKGGINMQFPDFSEFISTLTKEKLMEITQRVNEKHITADITMTNNGINSLFTASSTANVCFTLEILRLYHEWLSEHLS